MIYAAMLAFAITAILTPIAIPLLRMLKFGQSIRDIGPSWHNKKAGTPTMGGIAFIIGIVVATIVLCGFSSNVLLLLTGSLGFGIIGLMDDFIKIVLKRNLGLKAWQKIVLQLIVAIIFIIMGQGIGALDSNISIPFTSNLFDLGQWYLPVAVFIILATVNSVNLTDGIDGLASSVTGVVMIFFAAALFCLTNSFTYISSVTYVFAGACFGGLIGFLIYNSYPAKIFMGDTGSLFLGGAVVSLALIMKNPIIIVIVGFVYFVEALSVIVQVASFQLTGKRIFRMSPIHHHFEMCGWSEIKIVSVFSVVTGILALIAFYGILY